MPFTTQFFFSPNQEMNEVFKLVQPLYIINRFFEFIPFKLDKNGVKISLLSFVHVLYLVSAVGLALALRIINGGSYQQAGSFLSKITVNLSIFFTMLFCVYTALSNFVNRTKIERLLWRFIELEEKISNFGISTDFSSLYRNQLIAIAMVLIIFTATCLMPWIFSAIYVGSNFEEYFTGSISMCMWLGITYYMASCSLIYLFIATKFTQLHAILERIFEFNFRSPRTFNEVISMASVLQTKLSEIIEGSNRIFSFQMALVMGVCLIGSTFSSFEIYDLFVAEMTASKLIYAIGLSVVSLHYEVYVVLAVMSCSLAKTRERQLLDRLHAEMYGGGTGRSFRNKRRIHLLVLQMEHVNAQFSSGLFVFEWKILMSFFSAIFSNLIIMIQFDATFRSKATQHNIK